MDAERKRLGRLHLEAVAREHLQRRQVDLAGLRPARRGHAAADVAVDPQPRRADLELSPEPARPRRGARHRRSRSACESAACRPARRGRDRRPGRSARPSRSSEPRETSEIAPSAPRSTAEPSATSRSSRPTWRDSASAHGPSSTRARRCMPKNVVSSSAPSRTGPSVALAVGEAQRELSGRRVVLGGHRLQRAEPLAVDHRAVLVDEVERAVPEGPGRTELDRIHRADPQCLDRRRVQGGDGDRHAQQG